MRVTGSRAYTRPSPLPKMPPGLVELMEGLSKEILRNNPTDIYNFCATHMQKLVEIRDGPITKRNRSLSLDQKIAKAQEKVRQRAERRRQEYDLECHLKSGKEVDTNIVSDYKTIDLSEHEPLTENIPKGPVRHELDLADTSEIEISHEPILNSLVTEMVKYDDQKDKHKELTKEIDTIIEDKEKVNEDFHKISNIEGEKEDVLSQALDKSIDSDESKKTNDPDPEFTLTQGDIAQIDADVKNVNNNLKDKKIPHITNKDGHENDISPEVAQVPHYLDDVVEDVVQKATLLSSDATDSQTSHKVEINAVNRDEGTNIKQNETQSLHVEGELQQLESSSKYVQLPECNFVSEPMKEGEMEQDTNRKTTVSDIYTMSNEQETEPKLDEMAGQEQIETVKNDIKMNNTAVDIKAAVESETLSEKIYEESQGNNEELNDLTNNSISPIEILEAPENKQLETASTIDTSTIIPSVAGDDTKFHVDIEANNQTKPVFYIGDDNNHENVEPFASINNEEINPKDIRNNGVHTEVHEIDLNVEKDMEKSNMDENSKNGASNITEDTPKVNKEIIRNDVQVSNNMDLETAAITIQKVFRTFLFKSRASTFEDSVNSEANSIDEDNENKEECNYPITSPLKERRSLGITRMDTVLQTVNEEKSLSLSTDDSSTLSSAATIIQAHVRGYLVRNKLNSNKTVSSSSMLNSDGPNGTSPDNDPNPQKKTVLNIHIVPEAGHLSRDESIITSMDLSLDGSPPSSSNLHPLGYDKSERRKQLKREDAFQSISPPSNNSGKLSEDVDSVIEQCATDGHSHAKVNSTEKIDVEIRGVTPVGNPNNTTTANSLEQPEINLKNKRKYLHKMSSDEMDVVTPFGESELKNELNSEGTPKLLHSGELHDIVLPTKVSRSDTSVVREFKTVLVYFLIWNK